MNRVFAAAFAISVIIVAAPPFLCAVEIANGIYEFEADGQGNRVQRSSGGTINLRSKVSDNFGNVKIWSMSNQNDRFRVGMTDAGPLGGRTQLAIYVDGVCEVIGSYSQPAADGKSQVLADVVGLDNAQKVATHLNAKLHIRKHPGHQLQVTWKSVHESFKAGDPVLVELEIHNVGTAPVRFMEGGQQRGARDNQFGFTAFATSGYGKPVPDTGDPMNHGGLAAYRKLEPGEVFRKQVDLTKWFKFEKADTYQITGMYELKLQNQDFDMTGVWDDFAIGRCLVRIEK